MSKVECLGDVSSTVKSQSLMFRSSARTQTRTHTRTRTIRCISTPFSCCTSGIPKGAGMINPCTLPPSHAQTRRRARTHATHTCTQMAPRDKERTGTWATYQMSRQIFARWCIWASHPPIRPPSNHQPAREVLIDLLHTIYSLHPGSNRFRLSSCPPPPLSGFGWLFWERTFTQTHALESLRQRRRVLKCYHIYPQRIDAFKWAIGLLRMCHWSGAWQRREVEEKPPEVVPSVTAAFKSVHVSGTCCRRHLKGVRSAVPGAQLGKSNVPSAGPPPAAFGPKREMVITTRSASKNRYLVRIFPKHSKDCVVRSGWATAAGHHRNKQHFRLYGKELRI